MLQFLDLKSNEIIEIGPKGFSPRKANRRSAPSLLDVWLSIGTFSPNTCPVARTDFLRLLGSPHPANQLPRINLYKKKRWPVWMMSEAWDNDETARAIPRRVWLTPYELELRIRHNLWPLFRYTLDGKVTQNFGTGRFFTTHESILEALRTGSEVTVSATAPQALFRLTTPSHLTESQWQTYQEAMKGMPCPPEEHPDIFRERMERRMRERHTMLVVPKFSQGFEVSYRPPDIDRPGIGFIRMPETPWLSLIEAALWQHFGMTGEAVESLSPLNLHRWWDVSLKALRPVVDVMTRKYGSDLANDYPVFQKWPGCARSCASGVTGVAIQYRKGRPGAPMKGWLFAVKHGGNTVGYTSDYILAVLWRLGLEQERGMDTKKLRQQEEAGGVRPLTSAYWCIKAWLEGKYEAPVPARRFRKEDLMTAIKKVEPDGTAVIDINRIKALVEKGKGR